MLREVVFCLLLYVTFILKNHPKSLTYILKNKIIPRLLMFLSATEPEDDLTLPVSISHFDISACSN